MGEFEAMCQEYEDIFSAHSANIGHTNLITMDVDTGDSPHVISRPHTLPVKHHEGVKQELDTLECADIIR